MFNSVAITNKNNKNDDKKCPYRMLIIGPSRSGKTNALLNLIQKPDNDSLIDKIYLYAKDLSELKYQFLIKKREDTGIKNSQVHSLNIQALWIIFISILMIAIQKKRKVLIVFVKMLLIL